MSLYSEMKAAAVPMDSHESDLYVMDTPAAREVLRRFETANRSAKPFISQIDGMKWLDIPFAYDPWWQQRLPREVQP